MRGHTPCGSKSPQHLSPHDISRGPHRNGEDLNNKREGTKPREVRTMSREFISSSSGIKKYRGRMQKHSVRNFQSGKELTQRSHKKQNSRLAPPRRRLFQAKLTPESPSRKPRRQHPNQKKETRQLKIYSAPGMLRT